MFRFISTYLSRLRKPAFSNSWVKTFLIFDARAICFTDKILSEFALCKTKMIWVLKHILFLIALSDHRSWDYRKETLLSNRHQDACTLFEMCFLKLLSLLELCELTSCPRPATWFLHFTGKHTTCDHKWSLPGIQGEKQKSFHILTESLVFAFSGGVLFKTKKKSRF